MSILFLIGVMLAVVLICGAVWYVASDILILALRSLGETRTKYLIWSTSALVMVVAAGMVWYYATLDKRRITIAETEPPVAGALASVSSVSNSAPHTASPAPTMAGDLNQLVVRLRERLKREPDDVQGRALYARTLMELQRYTEAADAYAAATKAVTSDAALFFEWSDAAYMKHGQKWTPESTSALAQGLQLAPEHPEGLWLSGKERFENKDYTKALQHWEKLERVAPSGSEYALEVKDSLATARALRDGRPLPAKISVAVATTNRSLASELAAAIASFENSPTAAASSNSSKPSPASVTSVKGTISLDGSVATRAAPEDLVFVFARDATKPAGGMPLAVLRHRVADLPIQFEMSDNNAMSPQAKLSSAAQVVVVARVSKSGDAQARAGDLEGASTPVALGAKGVLVTINRVK